MKMNDKNKGLDIDNFDMQAEIDLINKHGRAVGHKLLIRLHMENEVTSGGLCLPDSVQAEGQYIQMTGYVAQMGPQAYMVEKEKGLEPWCKLSEWVVFVRNAAQVTKFQLGGLPVFTINDDQILHVINDPRSVAKIS